MKALACFFLSIASAQGSIYFKTSRLDYLQWAIISIQETPSSLLTDAQNYIDAANRGNCQSSMLNLKIQCLIHQADVFCDEKKNEKDKRCCPHYIDIIVTNALNEDRFFTEGERYEMMKKHTDVRPQIRRELRYRYGAIATEFIVSPYFRSLTGESFEARVRSLAEAIDPFCMSIAERGTHPWQTCAAALVWFIASEGKWSDG